MERALNLLLACRCVDGCPRCIYSPYCGNNNKILSKRNAIEILKEVVYGGKRLELYEERKGRPIA